MTDPITDMGNRIKNAQAVGQEKTEIPFSRMKLRIAEILKREGFILDVKTKVKKGKKNLVIVLKYPEKNVGAMAEFKRVSKPGRRIYKKSDEIKRVNNGYGVAIVSTSQGVITDREARKKKIGGEVLCEIW